MTEKRTEVRSDVGPFVIVPEWLLDSGVPQGAVVLYALLGTYADRKDHKCWPSRATLTRRLGASRNSVDRWLRDLRGVGAVSWEQRPGGEGAAGQTNIYTLRISDPHPHERDTPLPMRGAPPLPTDGDPPSPPEVHRTRTIEPEPKELENTSDSVPESNGCGSTDEVRVVFDAWVESTGRTGRTKLDVKRRRLIKQALGSYPVADVLAAVRGWESSDFHSGRDGGKVFNDLGLVLRDAAHIEQFRDFATTGRVKSQSKGRGYLEQRLREARERTAAGMTVEALEALVES